MALRLCLQAPFLFSFLLTLLLIQRTYGSEGRSRLTSSFAEEKQSGCNFFRGKWVFDASYSTYSSCPLIDSEFNCLANGRRDRKYLQYVWQPDACFLPRFDGEAFLRQWTGKKIMFVGDSLSLNMWQSLCCMILAVLPDARTSMGGQNSLRYVVFEDYQVSLLMYRSPYLVDVVRENVGNVLNLSSINGGSSWEGMDVLIFNSWHWWLHKGNSRQWDFISDGTSLYKDMDRLQAYRKGMTTWANWVDRTINTSKTRIFFQGISPTHYQGADWNQPKSNCKQQEVPLPGSTYPAGTPAAAEVVNNVLSSMSTFVYLLDVTTLSQLRVDGHPSAYSGGAVMDCSHWCLPGVPDTWNQLLYAVLRE